MTARIIDLNCRNQTVNLHGDLLGLIAAARAVDDATAKAQAPHQSEAGEYFTLCALNAAEERLVSLARNPEIVRFLEAAAAEIAVMLKETTDPAKLPYRGRW